jgi:hypothetical protein
MWVLDLTEEGGDSYGMYLMDCDFGEKNEVAGLIGKIIEDFDAAGNDEWTVTDISEELANRGYPNKYIDCLSVSV